MQENVLTISVDAANDGNPADETYTRYEEYKDRSTYIGANHSLDERDMLSIYRSFPTKNGNFKGTAKSAVKFTEDVEVSGVDGVATITAPVILEVSFSVPVGTTAAALTHVRQRALALLDDDTFMDSLNLQLLV